MQHLEPTYLRFIFDGLVKGSIHLENASESIELFKQPLTILILNHYDLTWLVVLDDEYEKLVENN